MNTSDAPRPADGLVMLAVPAPDLQPGDLVGLSGTWARIGRIDVANHETGAVVSVALTPLNTAQPPRTWHVGAGETIAILRPAGPAGTVVAEAQETADPGVHADAWTPRHNPFAPGATSTAVAAGWDDEPGWRCIHHGHESDTTPCPECHPHGVTTPPDTDAPAPFKPEDRVRIEPDPAMPGTIARRYHGRTGTLVKQVPTLNTRRRVWKVQLDGILPEAIQVQVREDALRHHDGSVAR